MNTHKRQPDEKTLGIPLAMKSSDDHCSIAVDDLVEFLGNVTRTQQALHEMGVDFSTAQSIRQGVQYFGLVPAGGVGKVSIAELPATDGESNRVDMLAVNTVRTCLKSAGAIISAATSPSLNTETEPSSDADVSATTEGLNVELIRRRVAGGPKYVILDGRPTPWAANLTKPSRGNPRPKPQPLETAPVGKEVHLIAFGNHRYHPENEAEVSAVEPGSRVVAENCSTERVLFAGSDALIRQRELEFPEDQTEP